MSSAFSCSTAKGRPLHIVMVAPPYFDIPTAGYGGIEAIVAELTDELVNRGHRVTLLASGKSGTQADFVQIWQDPLSERLGQPFP